MKREEKIGGGGKPQRGKGREVRAPRLPFVKKSKHPS